MAMDDDASFLGTGWSFPPRFDPVTRDAATVSAEADIRESLFILLSTTPGERLMRPTYGCDLRSMVFEQIDTNAETRIRNLVEQAVLFFEPRITLDAVTLDTAELADGLLKISLDYTVRSTNSRYNLVFPLYMQEGNAVRSLL
ncbi:GPW/gp25 family protein [Derxia lacustris]|uniref:GPW/gp25 family protein n=1 Tax=Derxia lacustris TaxID=764842 RepID=UPI001F3491B2|nr:GPW/gp25 family protein [Derxia lacustris]